MEVFAYLDAGTGSIIIQAIIGAVVGIGVVVKVYWGKITNFFRGSNSVSEETKETKKSSTETKKAAR